MSALSQRPAVAAVGLAVPHESAAEHVTGTALYTDDLVARTRDVLHAWPVQVMHAHARITGLRTAPALEVPGVVRVLTADDVPGVNDAGVKHDEPLFPTEVMFHGHAVCWVLGETLEAARLGAAAVEVDCEALPSLDHPGRGHRGRELPGRAAAAGPRRRRAPGSSRPPTSSAASSTFAGQEHFYLETHAALAQVDEGGQVFVQSSTQHPSETQEIVAHVLGLRQPRGHRAVPAHGRRVRRQGDAAPRLRRDRRARRGPHRPAGAAAAQPRPGHDDVGQAPRLPRQLARRLRRRRPAPGPRRHPHLRRRVEPGPLRAGAGPGAVPRRQRLLDPRTCGSTAASRAPTRPRRPRSAASAARRGCSSSRTSSAAAPRCSASTRSSCAGATSTRPGQATPYGQPVRHAERVARAWDQVGAPATSPRAARRSPRSTRTSPHTRRALAITPVKFGISFNLTAFNQAGALVHVYKDGSVLINHGGTEMGQGLHTKMLQVAATALGLPLHRVRLAPTRTDKVPNTSATAASSGADLNGGAVKNACEQVRDRLAQVAAVAARGAPRRRAFADGPGRGARQRRRPRRGRRSSPRPTSSGCSCGRPASTAPRACTGTPRGCRASRSSTSPTASRPPRSRSTASPAPTACAASTSSTTSATACPRWSTSARSRAASCRAPAG